jgi:hypothetical protein
VVQVLRCNVCRERFSVIGFELNRIQFNSSQHTHGPRPSHLALETSRLITMLLKFVCQRDGSVTETRSIPWHSES